MKAFILKRIPDYDKKISDMETAESAVMRKIRKYRHRPDIDDTIEQTEKTRVVAKLEAYIQARADIKSILQKLQDNIQLTLEKLED